MPGIRLGRLAAPLVAVLFAALPALAITYIAYAHCEIVALADAVFAGRIKQLVVPDGAESAEKPQMSIAMVEVTDVFKGDIKKGETIGILYWSHEAKGKPPDWESPDRYDVGETGVFALNKLTKDDTKRLGDFGLPPQAERAAWTNRFRRYSSQLNDPAFRDVAKVWLSPKDKVSDEKLCGFACFFLAKQGALTDAEMQSCLKTMDADQLRWSCTAAGLASSRAAIPVLLDIATKTGKYGDEAFLRASGCRLSDVAARAILAIVEDTEKDAPPLLRLALDGSSYDLRKELAFKILHCGRLRLVVRDGLVATGKDRLSIEAASVLKLVDKRVAYPIIQGMEGKIPHEKYVFLIERYHTLWAKRLVLQKGGSLDYTFDYTRDEVNQFHRVMDQNSNTAEVAEVRKAAEMQTDVFEKEGPNFSRITLDWYKRWESFSVPDGRVMVLTAKEREAAAQIILQAIKGKPFEPTRDTPALWLLDFYDPAWDVPPMEQGWVAEDGTFGLAALPDRVWGRSEELAKMLRSVHGKRDAGTRSAP